ncbi:aldehyde dehydrogenase (NADP(+)) [Aliikangiella marina]|uniref:Aldehyde dehydrogenase (NADP(+)) n=1 Tax=Aliikangiella marina TaxID=1712262 RepID=A0A545T596_9GAMM|nr:aldehyde dehydrogenase (NADP(+)) [Aliikangiella marina]TQV72396.1 aldehyde dehydrogenase (NADP(+)) [Aliikangiella marina]
MTKHKIFLAGEWRQADSEAWFSPYNPTTGQPIEDSYPVSSWQDCEVALKAASEAFEQLKTLGENKRALFLDAYANNIEANKDALAEIAHQETGLAVVPRLSEVELSRTTMQLREAANAIRQSSWRNIVIDFANNIRSWLEPIGPVVVFGPNNFPFAFGSISGGDFAAAIAAGNPVIAKAHPSHPGTTRLFTELAQQAAVSVGLPLASIQLVYAMSPENGLKLVSDQRTAATAFTGSKKAGLALKKAAEDAGNLIYLEMSSLNPVILLKGALSESSESIADEFTASCTMAAGQLCTKPGLVFVPNSELGDIFIAQIKSRFESAPVATLLSPDSATNIAKTSREQIRLGARRLTDLSSEEGERFCNNNLLLSVEGEQFLQNVEMFQAEMFGNAALVVRYREVTQLVTIINKMEGNLTGCIYSHSQNIDESDYQLLEPLLRQKVGRILNDKMPTGVAVSPAMNHGGPFPSTGHPGFTAVGLPASIQRFAGLKCYDNVRQSRLPDLLKDTPKQEGIWRHIDGQYQQTEDSTK